MKDLMHDLHDHLSAIQALQATTEALRHQPSSSGSVVSEELLRAQVQSVQAIKRRLLNTFCQQPQSHGPRH